MASAKAYLAALNRLLATYGVEPKDDTAASESNQGGHGAAVETAR